MGTLTRAPGPEEACRVVLTEAITRMEPRRADPEGGPGAA